MQLSQPQTRTPQQIISEKQFIQRRDALEKVLSSVEGRLVISEIFANFFMFQTPHNDHGSKTSYNCGQQSVCLWLRQWMKDAGIYMKYYPLIEKEDMDRSVSFQQQLAELMKTKVENKSIKE